MYLKHLISTSLSEPIFRYLQAFPISAINTILWKCLTYLHLHLLICDLRKFHSLEILVFNSTGGSRPIIEELSLWVIPDCLLLKAESDLGSPEGYPSLVTLARFLPCVTFVCLNICFLIEEALDRVNGCAPRDDQSAWNMVGNQLMLLEWN